MQIDMSLLIYCMTYTWLCIGFYIDNYPLKLAIVLEILLSEQNTATDRQLILNKCFGSVKKDTLGYDITNAIMAYFIVIKTIVLIYTDKELLSVKTRCTWSYVEITSDNLCLYQSKGGGGYYLHQKEHLIQRLCQGKVELSPLWFNLQGEVLGLAYWYRRKQAAG